MSPFAAQGWGETGDRQDCQRISGKLRRKSMAVLSVPFAMAASGRRGGAYLLLRTEMTRIAIFAALAAAAAAQAPGVGTIMDRVGRNQAQAVAQRQEFTFHKKQLLRLVRGNGKLAREENREYEVSPKDKGVQKELLRLEGKYEYKGKYVTYDRPGNKYKGLDARSAERRRGE